MLQDIILKLSEIFVKAPVGIQEATEVEPVFSGLIPSLPVFIASMASLFILTIIISYFAYIPVRNFLRARKQYIGDNIEKSENMNTDAQNALAKANQKLSSSKKEGKDVIRDYTTKANEERMNILNAANDDAAKIKATAYEQIKSDEEAMKIKLTEDATNIAILAAEKLIKENLSTANNKQMVEDFIKEISK